MGNKKELTIKEKILMNKLKPGMEVKVLNRNFKFTIAEIRIGEYDGRVRLYDSSGHNKPLDEIDHGLTISRRDMEKFVDNLEKEKEKKIAEYDKEINEVRDRIKYMSESYIETFDENEYRVYKALNAIDDDKLSQNAKIKEIAKLLS